MQQTADFSTVYVNAVSPAAAQQFKQQGYSGVQIGFDSSPVSGSVLAAVLGAGLILADVRPSLTTNGCIDRRCSDTETGGDILVHHAFCSELPCFPNDACGQDGKVMRFTAPHPFRVNPRSIRVSLGRSFRVLMQTVGITKVQPPLGRCISSILARASQEQVCGVDTRRIVAPMTDVKASGNGLFGMAQLPGDSVSFARLMLDAKPAIAIPCAVSSPRPTRIRTTRAVCFRPKTHRHRDMLGSHDEPPIRCATLPADLHSARQHSLMHPVYHKEG